MRYRRLLIILSLTVATAFCVLIFVALFSVKDITVDYSVYGSRVEGVEEVLASYKGRNLLFVGEGEIEQTIKDNFALKVDFVKKVYPSSIEVGVSSRQERFVIPTGEGDYYVVDEEYAVVAKRGDRCNFADELDNILVTFEVSEPPVININKHLDLTNAYVKGFKDTIEKFSSPRDEIESVSVVETAEKGNVRITLKTRVGVSIVIFKALEKTDEKASAAVAKFRFLSDSDKLTGKIECLMLADGSISAVYTTH